jgi:hypothetical protein
MKIKIQEVKYVHDPEAAKKWFQLYLELLKEQLLSQKTKEKN